MHRFRAGIFFLLAGVCLAADAVSPSSPSLCTAADNPACAAPANSAAVVSPAPVFPSARDRKLAKQAFQRGLKLEKSQNIEQAFYEFEEAARLTPMNTEYLAAREMTREHLAGAHLQRGDADLLAGRRPEALTEFSAALNLDPQNEFAQQRLQDAMGPPPAHNAGPPQVVARSDALTTNPVAGLTGLHDIHYRGDSKGLLTAVATSFGLSIVFDDTVATRHVRFDVDQADFATAIRAASEATKSFVVPLEPTVLFAAADTAENHRLFDRMGLRSFYIPGATAPSDLTDVVNSLRALFEFRFIHLDPASSVVTVRAPIPALESATRLLEQLNSPPPEVLLDVQVLEVSHSYATDIGLHIPNQFNLYNIPASALALAGGQSVQSLINQIISSGGINQAGNTTIAALIAQLMQSQSGSSIFNTPLATFGGGLTLMGLSLDQLAATLSLNESSATTIEHVELRAAQAKESTFKVGQRYPVLNGSFAPLSNSSAIAGVIGNQSYVAPVPSVNYEDLGLTIKAKPTVHRNSDVSLELDVQFRALGSGTVNGIPVINQREYNGGIALKDGEPAVIAGLLTTSDQRSLSGLPTFAQIPGFGFLASEHSNMEADDELMILMTPHIVREFGNTDPPEIWLSR